MRTIFKTLLVIFVLLVGICFYFTQGVHKVQKFNIRIGKLDNGQFKGAFRCPEGFAATFIIISDAPLPKSISGVFVVSNKSVSKEINFDLEQSEANIVSYKNSKKRYVQYPITNSEILDFVENMEAETVYNLSIKLSQSVENTYFEYTFTSSRMSEAKLAGAKQAPYWTGEKINETSVD